MTITGETVASITAWMQREFFRRKRNAAILGLSGGLDSAVVLALCVRTRGIDAYPVLMPAAESSEVSLGRARRFVAELGLNGTCRFHGIQKFLDAYHDGGWRSKIRLGNFAARIRMALLYDYAHALGGLVVGTSNRSEILLGYGTRWGDTACDINPLGNLLKTEVRLLAALLNVPQEIMDAVPSADLWPGQTDEAELGLTYAEVDKAFSDPDETLPIPIYERVQATAFKREPIPVWTP